jgi:alpha-tubulin suppressor-like RCC1 family protein
MANSSTPVLVSGLNNVSQIALGYHHSCGLMGSGPEAGQVRCWGYNGEGELGDGTTIAVRLTSVLVSGLNNVSQIALGTYHSCAVIGSGPEAGQVRCWGANYYGELGDGTTTNSLTSVLVSGLNNVSQIALGSYHSCGLIGSGPEAGLVRCWGRNNYSQLGDGTTTNSLTSVLVSGLSHVSQIALGTYHSCALIGSGPEAGLARCWGLNNYGQLGDGTKTSRNKPVYRMNLTNIQSIGISRGNHQCVVTSTQEVSCSGDNQSFQTGFNELTIRNVSGF